MNLRSMSNLSQRLIVGGASTFLVFLAILLSFESLFRPIFVLLCAGGIGVALWEFYSIARAVGFDPLRKCALACSTTYCLATFLSTPHGFNLELLPQITLVGSLAVTLGYFFVRGKQPIGNSAVTLFGLLYLTLPLSTLLSIVYFFPEESAHDGRIWLIYLILSTKMTDIGAYIAGKNFGTKKIAPYISPSKTVEGSIGGFFATLLTSVLYCQATPLLFNSREPLLPLTTSLWLGALIGLTAQFGDLAESLLKREGKIKDSNQLPGLGGILDMMDSLVFTAPLVYFFLKLHNAS